MTDTIKYDLDHLEAALRYAIKTGRMQLPTQKSYACECHICNITHYTLYKL